MVSAPELFSRRSKAGHRLDTAVRWCLAGSAVAAFGGASGFLLAWGRMVVPGWAVSAFFLAAALTLSVVRSSVRRRMDRAADEKLQRRRSIWWAMLAVVTVVVTGFLALPDLLFSASYQVLSPSGPGFCGAVVRESSFLFSGGGELYKVGFGGLGHEVSSWEADDGYRPIRYGTYDFKWTAEGAILRVSGSGHDPVWPGFHGFDCR